MPTTVFVAVIAAAMLHAIWNALAKSGPDKHLSMTAVTVGHAPFALAVLPFSPVPNMEAIPYILAGALIHVGYQLALLTAYRHGDLTQVYPIARGVAPLIVAAVSVGALGAVLSGSEMLAIGVIASGILSLTLVRRAEGQRNNMAAGFALLTGTFIASYSLVDGMGARVAESALGYYGWVAVLNAILFMAYMRVTRPGTLSRLPREARRTFVVGGGASFAAYGLVVWGFTQAPIALVTALRETSIVFALVIGVTFLKERLDLAKVVSTFITLFGAALLRLSRSGS